MPDSDNRRKHATERRTAVADEAMAIRHNLGRQDNTVTVWAEDDGQPFRAAIWAEDDNTVTVTFKGRPGRNCRVEVSDPDTRPPAAQPGGRVQNPKKKAARRYCPRGNPWAPGLTHARHIDVG
ncbi:hypothetical protein [Streptomyces sp. NPDC056549]|uniref:hypothetical protein n=1 Tax=Streptomyces sp. NPDC056549 TaxID=3345864 RepID=UPI0036B0AB4C